MGQSGAYLKGGAGDKWVLSGDFINQSTQNLTWNTVAADLVFTNVPAGSLNHLLSLAGADLGQTMAGYTNNFAWGSLDLTGQTLTLADGNDHPRRRPVRGQHPGGDPQRRQGHRHLRQHGLNIYYNRPSATLTWAA